MLTRGHDARRHGVPHVLVNLEFHHRNSANTNTLVCGLAHAIRYATWGFPDNPRKEPSYGDIMWHGHTFWLDAVCSSENSYREGPIHISTPGS